MTRRYFTTTVTKILVQEGLYGGCMAEVNPGPETALPNCASYWVTFSCSGDFNSKSNGNLKFQSAQLAFLIRQKFICLSTTRKKHNGYCFAQRIDVLIEKSINIINFQKYITLALWLTFAALNASTRWRDESPINSDFLSDAQENHSIEELALATYISQAGPRRRRG